MSKSVLSPSIIRLLAILALWAPLSCMAASSIALPDMGDSTANTISPDEERRIGQRIIYQLRQSGSLIEDPELTTYIQRLGQHLLSASEQEVTPFHFFLVNDPSINAFALPGGYIGIHSGLILASRTESELAAVVAHEIAHVTQRHIARSFEKATRMNLPITAAVLAAIIFGKGDPDVTEAVIASSIAGSTQMQLDFTRGNEKEADRVGIQLLALAGFDARSMPEFFKRLQQESRYYDGTVPEFLRTHPVTTSRISDSENRAEQYPLRPPPQNMNYEFIKARLLVMHSQAPQELVERLHADLKQGRYKNKSATRFSYALALQKSGEIKLARMEINKLVAESSSRIPFLRAQANIEQVAGDDESSLKTYRKALELYPGNEALTLDYANALLTMQKTTKARTLLDKFTRYNHSSFIAYKLLSQAEGRLGNKPAAALARAEYHYLRNELHMAIEQLQIAQEKENKDDYYSSRIEARLKKVKEELQHLETEQKSSPHKGRFD